MGRNDVCRIATVLYCYTMLLRERVQKFKTSSSSTSGNLEVESKYIWIQELAAKTWKTNGFLLQVCTIRSSRVQASRLQTCKARDRAKLPYHILSNGQDELRILVEAEYEAKSCFFTLARSSLKSRDVS